MHEANEENLRRGNEMRPEIQTFDLGCRLAITEKWWPWSVS